MPANIMFIYVPHYVKSAQHCFFFFLDFYLPVTHNTIFTILRTAGNTYKVIILQAILTVYNHATLTLLIIVTVLTILITLFFVSLHK